MTIAIILLCVVLALVTVTNVVLWYNSKTKDKRITFLQDYTKDLEFKLQEKEKEFREAQFQASVLEAKLNQIDYVLKRLGYHEIRGKLKPFLLSVEAANHGAR